MGLSEWVVLEVLLVVELLVLLVVELLVLLVVELLVLLVEVLLELLVLDELVEVGVRVLVELVETTEEVVEVGGTVDDDDDKGVLEGTSLVVLTGSVLVGELLGGWLEDEGVGVEVGV